MCKIALHLKKVCYKILMSIEYTRNKKYIIWSLVNLVLNFKVHGLRVAPECRNDPAYVYMYFFNVRVVK